MYSGNSLVRNVFGLALICSGLCALVWHNYAMLPAIPHRGTFIYIFAVIEVIAGIAVQFPGTARAGAGALGAIYLIFCLLGVPLIMKGPLVYNNYGGFFEEFSFVAGALIVYACSGGIESARKNIWGQIGYYSFALCLISFALEQAFYFAPTVGLVPKWIPPGQKFWAIATTVAFVLAGLALLTGIMAQLAARLNTVMLLAFGVVVWLPLLYANPHDFSNWSETAETFAITASAWVVADYVRQRRAARAA